MKTLHELFIAFILSAFSMVGYGQSKDAIIKDIKNSFQQINNDKSLKVVKLENEEFLQNMTDGGGSLTGYFKNDTLCKISVWAGLSFGIRQYEYYLKNGRLFFIYEKEEDFAATSSGTLDYKKLDLAFEGRYYMNEGKVIDIKVKGQKRFGEKPIINSLNNIQSDIKTYTKLLKSRLKK